MQTSQTKAFFYTIACVISWAFIPVVSRFGQVSLDNYQFLFWSSIFSFVVIFVSTWAFGKIHYLTTYNLRQLTIALFLGFLGTCLYYLLLYYGYAHAQGLEVLVLQYTWPIFVILFSVIILHEKITFRTLFAIILGFAGILFVLSKGDIANIHLDNLLVDFIVLLAASVFGLFSVLSKKYDFEPFSLTTYFFVSATIISFLAMLLFSSFTFPSSRSWISIIVNGAFINGFSYILWLLALKNARASFIAPFVFLTPVIAALLIVFFFGEALLPVYLLGLGCVVIAGLIAK